jgi:tryptophan synthase beta chain
LYESGRAQFLAATDDEALDASFQVAKLEGIIPALETGHAFHALKQLPLEKTDTVVVCLSGRGDKDLRTYMKVMEDKGVLD